MKTHLLISLSLLGGIVCQAGPRIHRIMPFTSDDSVRIDLFVAPEAASDSLSARILSAAGDTLWAGGLKEKGAFKSDTLFVARVDSLKPELWSTVNPVLYRLEVCCGDEVSAVRIGFRRFEMKDGNFYLNGRKIFLRGNAINPPGRGIPKPLEDSKEFARDYVRFLKGMNINMIRIPDSQNWMDVCDEEGMMLFGGRYGRPTGGTTKNPPLDFDEAMKAYMEKDLGDFASHPSMVLYTLSNEMATRGKTGVAYMEFLSKAHDWLKENWDDTRVYIGNAGYGLGRAGDVYDVHRYWGWYYNAYLTFLNLRDVNMWQNPGKTQAITFSECVGNYTGIDGRYNLCSRTKQPGSQKCWTGHVAPEEQGREALEYQAFVLKNVTEMFRRLRSINPYISGVMPFSIIFFDWDEVASFAEMKPKPAAYQYGISYQPVLLSWEIWNTNAKAGAKLPVFAHIVNDDDLGRDLSGARIEWRVESADRLVAASGTIPVPEVKYYGTWAGRLEIALPANLATGFYKLKGSVLLEDGTVVSRNDCEFFAASTEWVEPSLQPKRIARLYDPAGKTAKALAGIGVKTYPAGDLSRLFPKDILIIGEDAWDAKLASSKADLETFMQKGGRILCLRQKDSFDPSWISDGIKMLDFSSNDPTYISPSYEYVDGMNINVERPEHPVFDGIRRKNLRLWSDYTGFDETKEGFPKIFPVSGGYTAHGVDLTQSVIIANYTRNLSATALMETVHGKGSVILCAFDLSSRCGIDPVAEKLLGNLVGYAASYETPQPYTAVGKTIEWGDYSSEKGIVVGANNGLIVNTYPTVPVNKAAKYPLKVDDRGYHYVGGYGGWNNRPGIQYLPRGRRPFAPYGFTLGGGDISPDTEKGVSEGEGYFVAKAPEGTKTMATTFENNAKEAVSVTIDVNGAQKKTVKVAPGSTAVVEQSLPEDGRIRVNIKGDRRVVLLRTDFR